MCLFADEDNDRVASLAARRTKVPLLTVARVTLLQVSTRAIVAQRRILRTLVHVLAPRAARKQPLARRAPTTFTDTTQTDFTAVFQAYPLSLSVLTATFPGGPGLASTRVSPFWILLELRMMEVVVGNWSYKQKCKAPVKSLPPTNQHPTFHRPDALTVGQPTVSQY